MRANFDANLQGRTALVTGATRGLGRAMSFGLARAGADVIVVSRKQEACDTTAAEIAAATGVRTFAYACNVSHWDALDGLVDAAYVEFGRVDILINNAGLSPLYPSLVEVTEALWDKVVGINLKGPFRLSALVGARMAAGDGGSIINISSTGAVRPDPTMVPYACAKAGLNTMTVALALAYGPKVRVNCIMAGPFLTDASASWDADRVAHASRSFALQRLGQPDEIVGAALYFASDASSFTSGAVLAVNGGMP